jgi:flagellar hook-basal body complex protein FliE
MYLIATVVLVLGIGTRYGHRHSANAWTASTFERSSDNISERINTRIMEINARQDCANDRAAAVIARAEARAEEVMARREAANARVQAAIARINSKVVSVQINDDSE